MRFGVAHELRGQLPCPRGRGRRDSVCRAWRVVKGRMTRVRSRTHPSTGPARPFGRRSPGWRHLRPGYLPALAASLVLGVFVQAPNVFAATSVISITTTSLPSGEIGSPYSFKLAGSGGTGTYVWTV